MTLAQLLRSTLALRKRGANDTVIKSLQLATTGNGLLVLKAIMSSASRKGVFFDTWITFTQEKNRSKINAKSFAMCQCSCEDYIFMYEVANTAHNAARIFYSNGESPDERNPGQRPGLCKHLTRLVEELI